MKVCINCQELQATLQRKCRNCGSNKFRWAFKWEIDREIRATKRRQADALARDMAAQGESHEAAA